MQWPSRKRSRRILQDWGTDRETCRHRTIFRFLSGVILFLSASNRVGTAGIWKGRFPILYFLSRSIFFSKRLSFPVGPNARALRSSRCMQYMSIPYLKIRKRQVLLRLLAHYKICRRQVGAAAINCVDWKLRPLAKADGIIFFSDRSICTLDEPTWRWEKMQNFTGEDWLPKRTKSFSKFRSKST